MGFEFTLEHSKVKDSDIFCRNYGIMPDGKIKLNDLELTNAKLFCDLDMSSFCSKAEQKENAMTPQELESIRKVLKQRTDKAAFVAALWKHLVSFSEGVAASLVASCLTK